MDLFHKIDQLKLSHFHILHKSTGNPKEFAQRLGLSGRTLYRLLEELKDHDVHIAFSRSRGSYVYLDENIIEKLLKLWGGVK